MDNIRAMATPIQDRDVLYTPSAGPLPLPSSTNEMRRYVVSRYSPTMGHHWGWPTRLGIGVGGTNPCGPSPVTMCLTGVGDYTGEHTAWSGLSLVSESTTARPAQAERGEHHGTTRHTRHYPWMRRTQSHRSSRLHPPLRQRNRC